MRDTLEYALAIETTISTPAPRKPRLSEKQVRLLKTIRNEPNGRLHVRYLNGGENRTAGSLCRLGYAVSVRGELELTDIGRAAIAKAQGE